MIVALSRRFETRPDDGDWPPYAWMVEGPLGVVELLGWPPMPSPTPIIGSTLLFVDGVRQAMRLLVIGIHSRTPRGEDWSDMSPCPILHGPCAFTTIGFRAITIAHAAAMAPTSVEQDAMIYDALERIYAADLAS